MRDLRLRHLIPLGSLTAGILVVACGTKADNRTSDDPSGDGDGDGDQGHTGGQGQGETGGQGGDIPEDPDPTGSGGVTHSGGSESQDGGAAGASSGPGGMGGMSAEGPHTICDAVPPASASVLLADEWVPTTVNPNLDDHDDQREAFVQAVWVCRLVNEPVVWNNRCVPEHPEFRENYWEPVLEDWDAYANMAEERSVSVAYCAGLSVLAGACYVRQAVLSTHCAEEDNEVCAELDSCAIDTCSDRCGWRPRTCTYRNQNFECVDDYDYSY